MNDSRQPSLPVDLNQRQLDWSGEIWFASDVHRFLWRGGDGGEKGCTYDLMR